MYLLLNVDVSYMINDKLNFIISHFVDLRRWEMRITHVHINHVRLADAETYVAIIKVEVYK